MSKKLQIGKLYKCDDPHLVDWCGQAPWEFLNKNLELYSVIPIAGHNKVEVLCSTCDIKIGYIVLLVEIDLNNTTFNGETTYNNHQWVKVLYKEKIGWIENKVCVNLTEIL